MTIAGSKTEERWQQTGKTTKAWAFFNQLWGRLNLKLSEPPQPISERLLNEAALPSTRLGRVSLEVRVVVEIEDNDYRDLTEEEWRRVVLRVPIIRLRWLDESAVKHRAPDGASFTVRDLVAAIRRDGTSDAGQHRVVRWHRRPPCLLRWDHAR